MVEAGSFRHDLYYRINVIRLEMPPLRERKADIPPLAEAFLRRLSAARGRVVDGISRGALRRLMAHDFPGNVRELENILEHGYVLSEGRRIEEHDLPDWLLERAPSADSRVGLQALEAGFIRDVLARNHWNRTEAARELGIHKTTLHRKIRKLAIDLPAEDGRSARRVKREAAEGPTGPIRDRSSSA
jgi:DNA-binding NtrC family response regulator